MVGFCEPEDVRKALQETQLTAPYSPTEVNPAIHGLSRWFRDRTGGFWYDSNAGAGDEIGTTARSTGTVRMDVPSSPHRQGRQLFRGEYDDPHIRYPVTRSGPYVKIRLPWRYVDSIDTLEVRDRGGDITDWTTASDIVKGRGEDYYVEEEGAREYGTSYLYLHAATIGPRTDFTDLVSISVTHGLDYQDDKWDDVRRGIAYLAAADLELDDDLRTSIPNDGQLVGVDTKRQGHIDDAIGQAHSLLAPYLDPAVA